jgi:hypothetical protein
VALTATIGVEKFQDGLAIEPSDSGAPLAAGIIVGHLDGSEKKPTQQRGRT